MPYRRICFVDQIRMNRKLELMTNLAALCKAHGASRELLEIKSFGLEAR
ncbi:protein of unknown function (plasmid) [Pararobbsia alpina]